MPPYRVSDENYIILCNILDITAHWRSGAFPYLGI